MTEGAVDGSRGMVGDEVEVERSGKITRGIKWVDYQRKIYVDRSPRDLLFFAELYFEPTNLVGRSGSVSQPTSQNTSPSSLTAPLKPSDKTSIITNK